MAGGSGRVVTGGGIAGGKARVENERLWVDAFISGGGGGGGGGDVNIVAVGGNPVTTTVPVSGTVSVVEPVSVDDNGGSLTVDGTVAVSSVGGTVTIAEPVSVDDNGGSLTVDGTVAVSSVGGTVTVAEPVSVDDNGGSLTVDGTVAVSSVGGTVTVAGTVAVSSVGGTVTVAGTVAVGPTVTPGTGATDLGKAEDSVAASGDVGVMALTVRADTPAATGANGDYVPLLTDSTGRLHTTASVSGTVAVGPTVTPGTGATNLGKAEDAAHASGDVGVMALAVRQDTLSALAANGDYIPLVVDSSGRLNVFASGASPGGLGKVEDTAHVSADVGVMALAVRQDTIAALAANGDYIPLTTDALGRLRVMAENFTVLPLSSSTSGQPIVVNGGGFVAIHTVAASSIDVITIYVTNVGTADEILILGWGGTATGQQIYVFSPSQETVVAASEVILQAGQSIQANLLSAGTCRVFGRVTRRSA